MMRQDIPVLVRIVMLFAALVCGIISTWLTVKNLTVQKGIRILIVVLAALLIAVLLWAGDAGLAKLMPRHKDTWTLIECSVVKDDRVREGQSVQLILRGPTTIRASVWENQCRIPVGTKFHRQGGDVCNPSVAGPNDLGCYGIESESK